MARKRWITTSGTINSEIRYKSAADLVILDLRLPIVEG